MRARHVVQVLLDARELLLCTRLSSIVLRCMNIVRSEHYEWTIGVDMIQGAMQSIAMFPV
jgi:hypothetical protein